jgi:Transposase DDE domain group 1
MVKIQTSEEKVQSRGGIFFVYELLKQQNFDRLIDEHLGKCVKLFGYNYSDILFGLVMSQHCGATYTEDVYQLRSEFKNHPEFKVCSPDTLLRGYNELKTVTEVIISKSGVEHEFNVNPKLNALLLKILLKTGLLKTGESYMMDYDNTITECEKYDSQLSYKMENGYQPGVASIGKLPIYIEGRNGNSNAKFQLAQTLERCFNLTNGYGIKINAFRSDSAAYQQDVIELLQNNHTTFYLRCIESTDLKLNVKHIQQWEMIRYNGLLPVEPAETKHTPFAGDKEYRIIVQRKKKNIPQIDIFTQSSYDYYYIITDDLNNTPEQIFYIYNQRGGASEQCIDILKNDFNWNRLPCSFLDANTAFMLLSAISFVLYEWIKTIVCPYFHRLKPNARLKQFVFQFISVATKWIRSGRQIILKVFCTERGYENIPLRI